MTSCYDSQQHKISKEPRVKYSNRSHKPWSTPHSTGGGAVPAVVAGSCKSYYDCKF